jgi:hypothetical protein
MTSSYLRQFYVTILIRFRRSVCEFEIVRYKNINKVSPYVQGLKWCQCQNIRQDSRCLELCEFWNMWGLQERIRVLNATAPYFWALFMSLLVFLDILYNILNIYGHPIWHLYYSLAFYVSFVINLGFLYNTRIVSGHFVYSSFCKRVKINKFTFFIAFRLNW